MLLLSINYITIKLIKIDTKKHISILNIYFIMKK